MGWKSFVAGAVVGTGIGMMLAPRPGDETRERLREGAGDMLAGQSTVGDMVEEVREIFREAVSEVKASVRDAIEEGKRESARTQAEMMREYREKVDKAE